jgi:hypothetical protein
LASSSSIEGDIKLALVPIFRCNASDIVEGIFVPIASDRLLVGSQNGVRITPEIDDLNPEFAAHSVDEFSACEKTDRELSLREAISVLGCLRCG